jgi:hypothetical protein
VGPFEHHGRGAQDESIARAQEREYGRNQGALPPVLPVELIIDIPDRAPSVPEVGIRSQCGPQPLQNLIHPSAVDMTQLGAKRRRDASWCGTRDSFRCEDGAEHEYHVPR